MICFAEDGKFFRFRYEVSNEARYIDQTSVTEVDEGVECDMIVVGSYLGMSYPRAILSPEAEEHIEIAREPVRQAKIDWSNTYPVVEQGDDFWDCAAKVGFDDVSSLKGTISNERTSIEYSTSKNRMTIVTDVESMGRVEYTEDGAPPDDLFMSIWDDFHGNHRAKDTDPALLRLADYLDTPEL